MRAVEKLGQTRRNLPVADIREELEALHIHMQIVRIYDGGEETRMLRRTVL
jgi:hypothetical protein